jgi:glycosyltransferase involved in cell wall biosynthesis
MVHSSLAYSLVNFRGRLLAALVDQGHDVIATAPDRDVQVEEELARMGVSFKQVTMARASLSPVMDLRTLARYFALMREWRPDVVIAYTQKPIIYGGLAARMAGIPRYYVIMSGLGFLFSSNGVWRSALRTIVSLVYRQSVRRAHTIFVFNSDDRAEMLSRGIIDGDHRVTQVPGSGVDTERFAAQPLPHSPPTILMVARLMRDKGVHEFVASARIVKQHFPEARFQILGRPEERNPTGVSRQEVAQWAHEGIVELLPETRDVRPHLAAATIFALPSYYREGLPRTILEALATGRPVVTTTLPGCRDAIQHGVTGLLVAPRDPIALANAFLDLLSNPARLSVMSAAARLVAEQKYDVKLVNRALIEGMSLDVSESDARGFARAGDSPIVPLAGTPWREPLTAARSTHSPGSEENRAGA